MQLIPDYPCRFGRIFGLRLGVYHEHTQLRRRVIVGGDGGGELLFANRAVQSRCASRRQHGRRDVEHRGVRIQSARGSPAEHQLALSDVAGELAIAKIVVPRLGRPRMPLRVAGFQFSVQLLHAAQCVRWIDVARDAEDRVARPIEVPVETVHHVARERAKARLPPNAPATHAVRIVEQLVQRLGRNGRGIVGLPLRFLDDDLHLFRELARIYHRIRVRVGLNLQPFRESRRRQHRVVGRGVVNRVGVQVSAARLGLLRDVADPAFPGALEEHVLESVGKAVLFVRLVEVTGFDVRDDRDDGGGPVLLN